MKGFPWTLERVSPAQDIFNRGGSVVEAAEALNVAPKVIYTLIGRGTLKRDKTVRPEPKPSEYRDCLSCGQSFEAESKVNFMCQACCHMATPWGIGFQL
jgi:hypothetical protein